VHLLAEESINIKRPVPEVFDYVTDMERFGDWFPGVLAIEPANWRKPGQVGKEYLETVAVPLRGRRQISIIVRESQPGKFFATEGKFPPLLPRMEVEFEPGEGGTCDLTWRMFSRNRGLVFRFTMLPLARRIMKKRAAIGLRRLGTKLEQGENRAAIC
jgi:hypothetical protein